jgi:hypothetical protein
MKTYILLITLFLFSVSIFAGPITSGGGMSVVCNFERGQQAYLLDYYEALSIYGEDKVERATDNLLVDFTKLVNNSYYLRGSSTENSPTDLKLMLDGFFSRVRWAQSDELPFLNDYGETVEIPDECSIKQLAIFYDETDLIYVDKNLWNKLDNMNKAAFVIHEAIYKVERQLGESTSKTTRSFVQQQLTAKYQIPINHGAENARYLCHTTGAEYAFGVTLNETGSTLHFLNFGMQSLLVKSTISLNYHFKIKGDLTSFAIPDDLSVNNVGIYKLNTSHRNDLSLKIEFSGGKPVLIQGLKKGILFGEKTKIICY